MADPAEGFFGGLFVMGCIACMLKCLVCPTNHVAFITSCLKVAWVCFLDTSHTAFCIIILYYYLIVNFGNTGAWKMLNWYHEYRSTISVIMVHCCMCLLEPPHITVLSARHPFCEVRLVAQQGPSVPRPVRDGSIEALHQLAPGNGRVPRLLHRNAHR
ncbi:hypothetical protein LXA43DRAFT_666004 [Ganoderma leucocontextum]|nr:hypothetical protein LXA43DRAFT_666004 [Ganoderma leucocontextum]